MNNGISDTISLAAVGDVLLGAHIERADEGVIQIPRKDPERAFDLVLPYLRDADIAFCNLEASLSERGKSAPGRVSAYRLPPEMVKGLVAAGFDVVNLANNHVMDFGAEPLLDTLAILDQNGIAHIGAGTNLQEARRPVILERKGCRVGFLGYTTDVNQAGRKIYARPNRPGVAAVRIDPLFGSPHVALEDLEMIVNDVQEVKKKADITVVSLHFSTGTIGSHTTTPHQVAMAKTAIDGGADLVLGHGPHFLQGCEVYQGKVICYNLADFLVDREVPHGESILLAVQIRQKKIQRVSFYPVRVNAAGQPEVVSFRSEAGKEMKDLLIKLCSRHNLKPAFTDREGIILG